MDFEDRRKLADTLVSVLKTALWDEAVIHQRLVHVHYGAERLVPKDVHSLIRFTRTETTRHIKFAPDCFVVDKQYPE